VSDTTGKTKDAGWEVGVRTTVRAAVEDVWDYLFEDGLPVWLGLDTLVLEKGASFHTDDGVSGHVLSYTPGKRIRLSWHPDGWDHGSTLQVTAREAATGTTIGFHQEKLAGREERKIMLGHWKGVVAQIERAFDGH
jgi:uncharacterized protein YndB with AHSA1/START domain